MRLDGVVWRIAGAAVSWALFTFCFVLLVLGASVVMGLGGYCASGGPYEIEVQCPDAVGFTMPLSVFGGLAAVGIGAIVARGFGVPLVSWAWPVLFVGLGAAFLLAGKQPGGFTFLAIGVLFVFMGAIPFVMEVRADARGLFLGATNARDEGFITTRDPRPSVFAQTRARSTTEATVTPSAGDWMRSLGLWIASVALGTWGAWSLFEAF